MSCSSLLGPILQSKSFDSLPFQSHCHFYLMFIFLYYYFPMVFSGKRNKQLCSVCHLICTISTFTYLKKNIIEVTICFGTLPIGPPSFLPFPQNMLLSQPSRHIQVANSDITSSSITPFFWWRISGR